MAIKICFENPIFDEAQVAELTIDAVNNFYASVSEVERLNLFFMLLASLQFYLNRNDPIKAAHLSYIISYYLFNGITPPASDMLALHYIRQAISLNDLSEYHRWMTIVFRGN